MDTTLSLRTTERAATIFRARAKAAGLSMGAYLDKITQQSAIKAAQAPIRTPTTPEAWVDAPNAATPASSTPKSTERPAPPANPSESCPISPDREHKWGGVGASGTIRRCQHCQIRKLPNGSLVPPNPEPNGPHD